MPKEDYLLKYLEKIGEVIALMLGLRQKGLPQEALQIAAPVLKEALNADFETIRTLTVTDFASLAEKEKFNRQQLETLAQLTLQIADIYTDTSEIDNAKSFYEKSLFLYQKLSATDKTFSFEREKIMADLKEKISEK
jgi:tetratricopeptide (TPR) repeat protein